MEDIRNILLALKRLHFNGILYESLDSRTLELCDKLGMLAAIRHVMPPLVRNGECLPGVPNQGIPFAAYLSNRCAGARKDLEEAISGIVRKFRNHPSVVIWMLNPLLCWNPNWINPNTIDAEPRQSNVMLASLREEAFLRRLDPTRIVIQSMGANTGAVISCNPYPTFSNQPNEWLIGRCAGRNGGKSRFFWKRSLCRLPSILHRFTVLQKNISTAGPTCANYSTNMQCVISAIRSTTPPNRK